MSQENVSAVKRGVDAYNRRDVEALLEELDPDVEWVSGLLSPFASEARVYRGPEGVREMLGDQFEALSEIHIEYSQIQDLGDRIVAIGSIRARGRESGAETESPHASVVDFKNGKVIRERAYFGHSEALEAAGLRE
jgi:ketosteroid isomerase-like protein